MTGRDLFLLWLGFVFGLACRRIRGNSQHMIGAAEGQPTTYAAEREYLLAFVSNANRFMLYCLATSGAAILACALTGAMIFGKRQGPSQGEAVSFVIVLVAVSVFLTWLGLRFWYGKDWWVRMAVDEHGSSKATPRDLE